MKAKALLATHGIITRSISGSLSIFSDNSAKKSHRVDSGSGSRVASHDVVSQILYYIFIYSLFS